MVLMRRKIPGAIQFISFSRHEFKTSLAVRAKDETFSPLAMNGRLMNRFAYICGALACLALISSATVLPGLRVGALDRSRVRWEKLDKGTLDGLHHFDETDYAFNVTRNLDFCRLNIENIVNDGNVDDYGLIIQRAFDTLFRKGGGTVRLSPGLFWQKTPIEIPSYCCLQGSGMHETILKTHEDAPPFLYAGAIRTAFTIHVSMFDFTQDGNRWKMSGSAHNRFGIYTDLANFVWMKNVKVVDNMSFGFDPHGANTAWSYYLVIEDCYASGNGKDGYTIDQYYYVSVLNSVAVDNDRHGINVVSGSRYVIVKGNNVTRNGYCSLVAQNNEFGTRSVLFMNNIAMDYRSAGICIRGVKEVYAVWNKLMSTRRPRAGAFELSNVWDAKLIGTEWMQSGRKTNIRGDALFDEYDTKVVPRTNAVIGRYRSYFADIEKPPEHLVNLSSTSYGTARVNNTVPVQFSRQENPLPPRYRTHVQFEHAKTNNAIGSDKMCTKGIVSGVTCCPLVCELSDDSNAAARLPSAALRRLEWMQAHVTLSRRRAFLSRKYNTLAKRSGAADPTCSTGRKSKRLCCHVECEICGGKGCGNQPGTNKMCCQDKIEKMGRSCAEYAPPCMLPMME